MRDMRECARTCALRARTAAAWRKQLTHGCVSLAFLLCLSHVSVACLASRPPAPFSLQGVVPHKDMDDDGGQQSGVASSVSTSTSSVSTSTTQFSSAPAPGHVLYLCVCVCV